MTEFLSAGTFVEEVPAEVQTVTAVSTSTLGTAGWTRKGVEDDPILITGPDSQTKKLGALSPDTYLGLCLLAFFSNGGRRAYVVRVPPEDAVSATAEVQSKHYDQQIEEGTGAATAFSKTSLTTTLAVNGGVSPVVAKVSGVSATFGIRWRQAASPVSGERLKQRDRSTNITLANGTAFYEFSILSTSLPSLSEGDLKQYVVVPGTLVISFDPDGGGARTLTLPEPTSGTTSSVSGNGTTTDTATLAIFDHATGRGSIRFGQTDVNDVPNASVVATSLTAAYTPTTATKFIADDGAGALVDVTSGALSAPGTINYNTGAYSFSATTAPHDEAPILATYYVAAWALTPVSRGTWAEDVRLTVSGDPDYFDSATQSYSKFAVSESELNSESGLYVLSATYEALDFGDSSSADYFPDVISELSDRLDVTTPGADEAPGTLAGLGCSTVLGGGDESTGGQTFGGSTGAVLLNTYLTDLGFSVGKRSVSIGYTKIGVAATGSMTCVAKASIISGETFTLDDGFNAATTFDFDTTGAHAPAGSNIDLDISAATTATEVRDLVVTAINAQGATLRIFATASSTADIILTNTVQGEIGNTTQSETVANAGFLISNMVGGADPEAGEITDDGTGLLTGDVDGSYATTITISGTDIGPNEIDYDLGIANFKLATKAKAGTLITAVFYTAPEETSHVEQFGDTTKTWTDSDAVVHYIAGSDGTFTSVNYGRDQFTSPTLEAEKRGIFALNKLDDLMQVILPDFVGDVTITGDLLDYAAARVNQPSGGDRFLILAPPVGSDEQEAVDWFRFDLGRFTKFGALYWPWIKVADPLANGRPLLIPPVGHVAGIYARTDITKNVSKAPAGTVDGALDFLLGLEFSPTQGQRDLVYSNKINPLISSTQTGMCVWGARTMALEAEWKYVQVRRLFMFLEKSIFNATGWVIFENNGPGLWSRIKTQLDAFMNNLFKQGYFRGANPAQAYFVRVDSTNNDSATIEAGQVITDIGAAGQKPAEFSRMRFQQITV